MGLQFEDFCWFKCSFIYLFNEVFPSSDNTALNGRIISNDELQKFGRKRSWPNLNYLYSTFLNDYG